MSDEALMAELMRHRIPMGGAGGFNREFAILRLRQHNAESPTGLTNISSWSASQTHSHPSSSERSRITNSEQRIKEETRRAAIAAMAMALKNNRQRNRGETAAEISEIVGIQKDDEYELKFSEDEIGPSQYDDYNLCTEAYLLGLSQDIQIGDDTVLGYLYDISEGDEASNDGKSVVENLINRFADEITEDVKAASIYGSLDDSVTSEASESSSVLSNCSATGVLHLLSLIHI